MKLGEKAAYYRPAGSYPLSLRLLVPVILSFSKIFISAFSSPRRSFVGAGEWLTGRTYLPKIKSNPDCFLVARLLPVVLPYSGGDRLWPSDDFAGIEISITSRPAARLQSACRYVVMSSRRSLLRNLVSSPTAVGKLREGVGAGIGDMRIPAQLTFLSRCSRSDQWQHLCRPILPLNAFWT